MIKTVLIVAVMLVVFNGVILYSGVLDRLRDSGQAAIPAARVNQDVIDVFRFTLEDEVNKTNGKPIEGYEPEMFLALFPGLVQTDFANVQSSIGGYTVVDGQVRHDLGQAELVHSAAGAITREGYETLLRNVSARTGIDLATDGTITSVMSALTEN